MSQSAAEKRVNDVIVEAKAAADSARKGAAKLAFWLTASLLFGAFAQPWPRLKADSCATERGRTVV
jgi:hypothetical protein